MVDRERIGIVFFPLVYNGFRRNVRFMTNDLDRSAKKARVARKIDRRGGPTEGFSRCADERVRGRNRCEPVAAISRQETPSKRKVRSSSLTASVFPHSPLFVEPRAGRFLARFIDRMSSGRNVLRVRANVYNNILGFVRRVDWLRIRTTFPGNSL